MQGPGSATAPPHGGYWRFAAGPAPAAAAPARVQRLQQLKTRKPKSVGNRQFSLQHHFTSCSGIQPVPPGDRAPTPHRSRFRTFDLISSSVPEKLLGNSAGPTSSSCRPIKRWPREGSARGEIWSMLVIVEPVPILSRAGAEPPRMRRPNQYRTDPSRRWQISGIEWFPTSS